jgi:hypothetical protein
MSRLLAIEALGLCHLRQEPLTDWGARPQVMTASLCTYNAYPSHNVLTFLASVSERNRTVPKLVEKNWGHLIASGRITYSVNTGCLAMDRDCQYSSVGQILSLWNK